MSTLIPTAGIFSVMDYFIDRMPGYQPEFVFGVALNFSVLIA
jgi:hypothetical protein